jgi:hypothetical protein
MAKPEPQPFSRAIENLIADFRGIPENRSRSRPRTARPLGELVEQLIVKHQIGRPSPEQALRDRWTEIVGAANAAYCHPVRIERGRLLVLVSHAVVRNELFMHRDPLLKKIRAVPGCEDIRELNLRAG